MVHIQVLTLLSLQFILLEILEYFNYYLILLIYYLMDQIYLIVNHSLRL